MKNIFVFNKSLYSIVAYTICVCVLKLKRSSLEGRPPHDIHNELATMCPVFKVKKSEKKYCVIFVFKPRYFNDGVQIFKT